ncbi:class I SAM-dependent methyltransferase [Amycolatopsis sp. NPDC050768]|uniref:class I SAM-dependent methyltransferase n=1 Tax=Amycolatopsis sp. NPDC050768 TaxID=3154839 RepID=UPI0033DE2C20
MIGSFPQYEQFADEFLDHARDGFYNAHVDRPACLELLGDVAGRDVLDAACGPGLYAEELVARGARVTGFDLSPRMVELSRARVPGAAFRVHDLGAPLGWLADASVDLVLLALVFEYVDDRVAMLRELHRVLRPGGALVLSRIHPTADWLRHGGNYFEPRVVEETWVNGWHVRFWLSPLQDTCAELREAGFLIERLVEPRPQVAGAEVDPVRYERLSCEPTGFLAIRAIPDPRVR